MARVLIGCDHRGVETCSRVMDWCSGHGHTPDYLGPDTTESVDYPDYAFPLAEKIVKSKGRAVGVLVCGWGNGMVIAANKVKGARAALCMDKVQAQYARWHNNANILVVSAEATGWGMIEEILDAFLTEKFEGGRHARRLRKIDTYSADSDCCG